MGIGSLSMDVGNNPVMFAMLAMGQDIPTDQRRLVPLTARTVVAACPVSALQQGLALVGQTQGVFTCFWHPWINESYF